MKKLQILTFFFFIFICGISAQQKYFANQPSILYSDTLRTKMLGSIPQGEKISVTKIYENFYRVRYKGYAGYIEKNNLTAITTSASLPQTMTTDLQPEGPNTLLTENIELLHRYTQKHRKALNATYFLLGGCILFSGIGSGLFVISDTSIPYVLFGLGGTCGLGAFISEICAMEFQASINKTNVKIQYLGNGMKISF